MTSDYPESTPGSETADQARAKLSSATPEQRLKLFRDGMSVANARIEQTGECWLMCNDCGARLWLFDEVRDASRSCPYQRVGVCDPR